MAGENTSEDTSALLSTERNLYNPRKEIEDPALHRVRPDRRSGVDNAWGNDGIVITPAHNAEVSSFGKFFLIFSVLALVGTLSFMAWRFMSARNVVQASSIDMAADITPYVEGGETVPLSVTIQNRNANSLLSATLSITYEKGVGENDAKERVTEKQEIGDVGQGEFKRATFNVVLFGKESDTRDISVKLEYKVRGSNAVFSKQSVASVVLKTPPLSLVVDGPKNLSQGQLGTYTFTVKNNTSTTTTNVLLKLTLPTSFVIDGTVPAISGRDTVWPVDELLPGESVHVTVRGKIVGQSGERSTIKSVVGSKSGAFNEIGVVYSSDNYDIAVTTSPLSLTITGDTERGASSGIRYGDKLTLYVAYANRGKDPLNDVILNVSFAGNAAIISNITAPDGYYDSSIPQMIFSPASAKALLRVEPGQQGVFKVFVPIIQKGSNSPSLTVSVAGLASRQAEKDTITEVSKKWVVEGSVSLSGYTSYKVSPFQNTGPVPPQVNTVTSYTAHLVASAQNTISNASVVFSLPAYVTWANTFTEGEKVTYDSRSRTVTWLVGTIESGGSRTADIQLQVRPSQTHLGQSPAITSALSLDGLETDSRARVKVGSGALTTLLSQEVFDVGDPSRVVAGE